jgi:hypothetical protein
MRTPLKILLLTLVPIVVLGQPDSKENLNKKAHIPELSNSSNQIDLRIYLDRGITNGGHFLWIRKNEGNWAGTKYDYFLKIRKNGKIGKIKKVNATSVEPTNSWEMLWRTLNEQRISELTSQDSIQHKLRKEVTTPRGKGYQVISVMDGSDYYIELKEDKKIIKYSFHSPWVYLDNFPDVEELKNYCEIVSIIESELKIKFKH